MKRHIPAFNDKVGTAESSGWIPRSTEDVKSAPGMSFGHRTVTAHADHQPPVSDMMCGVLVWCRGLQPSRPVQPGEERAWWRLSKSEYRHVLFGHVGKACCCP
jgi:hypothetical protein